MNDDALRKIIRELAEEALDETSTSAGAGPYNTPFAFRGNSPKGKSKAKKIAGQAGYKTTNNDEPADSVAVPPIKRVKMGEQHVNEGKYAEFKMSEGTDTQKIGRAMRIVNNQLKEVHKMLIMAERLKTESGTNHDQLWKSTAKALTKLESRLHTMSARIRNLKS